MTLDLGALKIGVLVSNDEAKAKLNETSTAVADVESKGNNKFASLSKGALGVGTAIAGMATATVGGMTALADKTADTADRIDKLSDHGGWHGNVRRVSGPSGGRCPVCLCRRSRVRRA